MVTRSPKDREGQYSDRCAATPQGRIQNYDAKQLPVHAQDRDYDLNLVDARAST